MSITTQDELKKPTEELIANVWDALSQLDNLWDSVSMDMSSRVQRVSYAYKNLNKLLAEIVNSEKATVQGVFDDIQRRRNGVNELRELFKMPPFDDTAYKPNSISLLKALDKDLTALRQRKQKLIDRQQEVYDEYRALCFRTDSSAILIEDIANNIAPDDQMVDISMKLEGLKKVLADRLLRVAELQEESRKIQETLSHHSSLGRDEMALLNTNFADNNTVASKSVIAKLEILEQKLKDSYDEWIEQVAFRYDELLVKMSELANKCFNINSVHNYPRDFDPELHGERDLQKMEQNIKELEEKYERGRPVFEKLNEFNGLWREKLDAERRVCRTSFYKNRGGALNASLKRQKKVCQQVPKVFRELKDIVADYVSKYDLADILVEGMLPDKYAEYMMEEYDRDREVQKAQKQFHKKNGKENNPVGSSGGSGKTHGRSVFKTHETMVSPAPSTTSAYTITRKRSISCSQISLISPTKPPLPQGLPISSSPKVRRMQSPSRLPILLKQPFDMKTPQKSAGSTGSGSSITPLVKKGKSQTPNRPWY